MSVRPVTAGTGRPRLRLFSGERSAGNLRQSRTTTTRRCSCIHPFRRASSGPPRASGPCNAAPSVRRKVEKATRDPRCVPTKRPCSVFDDRRPIGQRVAPAVDPQTPNDHRTRSTSCWAIAPGSRSTGDRSPVGVGSLPTSPPECCTGSLLSARTCVSLSSSPLRLPDQPSPPRVSGSTGRTGKRHVPQNVR